MRFAVIARVPTPTNRCLTAASGGRWELMTPEKALRSLRSGDAALGRLDVRETLDGVDDGLWVLGALEARGVAVLNGAAVLLATHDKLLTARLLRRLGVPHPTTAHYRPGRPVDLIRPPVVVKPRFGSCGAGVVLCRDELELVEKLTELEDVPWFREQGVLVQEVIPPRGYDLRVLVAEANVVGAALRIAAEGEWRTNIALGGVRQPVAEAPDAATRIAIAAARAVGGALVGVDLMKDEHDDWTVIEVNGAAEFTSEYLPRGDVFGDVVSALDTSALREIGHKAPLGSAL